jgi:Flp pilus assembly pilin Flp
MLSPIFSYMRHLGARLGGERGATMVEYGIIVALIAVVSILVIGAVGIDVFQGFNSTQANITTPVAPLDCDPACP